MQKKHAHTCTRAEDLHGKQPGGCCHTPWGPKQKPGVILASTTNVGFIDKINSNSSVNNENKSDRVLELRLSFYEVRVCSFMFVE